MKKVLLCILFLPFVGYSQTCNKEDFYSLIDRADLIIVGKIKKVNPSMGYWSGITLNLQVVKYEVIDKIYGNYQKKELLVAHPIFYNTTSVDPKEPQLLAKVFSTGNKIILFLEKKHVEVKYLGRKIKADFQTWDGDCGAVPLQPNIVEEIKEKIKTKVE